MENLTVMFVKPDPQAQARKCNASLRASTRKLDREIAHMKQQETKAKNLILQANKRASRDTQRQAQAQALRDAWIFAGELIKYRRTSARLMTSKAQLKSIQMQVNESLAVSKIAGSIRASASVMRDVNSLIRLPELAGIMQELSKELMKAGIIEEMVGEALPEEGFAEFEEEADEVEVDKVLGEILKDHVATVQQLPTTSIPVEPVSTTPDQEYEEEEAGEMMDQMRNRLDTCS